MAAQTGCFLLWSVGMISHGEWLMVVVGLPAAISLAARLLTDEQRVTMHSNQVVLFRMLFEPSREPKPDGRSQLTRQEQDAADLDHALWILNALDGECAPVSELHLQAASRSAAMMHVAQDRQRPADGET